MLHRRTFLAGLIAAPAIVKASSLMKLAPTEIIKPWCLTLPQPGEVYTALTTGMSDNSGMRFADSWGNEVHLDLAGLYLTDGINRRVGPLPICCGMNIVCHAN